MEDCFSAGILGEEERIKKGVFWLFLFILGCGLLFVGCVNVPS